MTDDDVEEQLADLTARVEAFSRSREHLAERVADLEETVEELETENSMLRDKVDAFGDIGGEKSTKEQKIAAVVTYADNERSSGQDIVTLSIKNIKGAAGISRRYGYDLADAMINGDGENGPVGPDGFDWALDPANASQYGSLEIDKDANKGVAIDFERLHEDPAAVNKFTTSSPGVGVAD